jgi:hypothetical protein
MSLPALIIQYARANDWVSGLAYEDLARTWGYIFWMHIQQKPQLFRAVVSRPTTEAVGVVHSYYMKTHGEVKKTHSLKIGIW